MMLCQSRNGEGAGDPLWGGQGDSQKNFPSLCVQKMLVVSNPYTKRIRFLLISLISRKNGMFFSYSLNVCLLTGKGKRWKNLYFILEGNDAQLIYFESEKRATKPKGLIDLSVCSVYGVHESLFGR